MSYHVLYIIAGSVPATHVRRPIIRIVSSQDAPRVFIVGYERKGDLDTKVYTYAYCALEDVFSV